MSYIEDLASAGMATGVIGGDQTLTALKSVIHLPPNSRTLDVGCNGGYLSIRLADAFAGDVVGVDQSQAFVDLAKKTGQGTTVAGKLSFVVGNILDAGLDLGNFDLVVHRGLEAFTKNREELQKAMVSRLKNWGYLVNITHTYESKPDAAIISELNKTAGLFIKPMSRRDLVAEYQAIGLRLIHQEEVPLEPNAQPRFREGIPNDVVERLRKVFDVARKNDAQTRASLLVFRRPLNVFGEDVAKG